MRRLDRSFASLALLAAALAAPLVLGGCTKLQPAGAITIRLQGHGRGEVMVYGSGSGSFANAKFIEKCILSSDIYRPEERECIVYLGDSLNAGDFIILAAYGSDPYHHQSFQEPGQPAVMRGNQHSIRATTEPNLVGVTYTTTPPDGWFRFRVEGSRSAGSGLIKSSPQGILCRLEADGLDSGNCNMELPAGTRIELTAEPDLNVAVSSYDIAGYFDGIGVYRSRCTGPTCAFTLDDDMKASVVLAVEATLAIDCAGGEGGVLEPSVGINCMCSATGSGRGTCRVGNLAGRSLTLVAQPTTAAPFEGWTISNAPGSCPASEGTRCALTVPEGSTTVSVKFGPKRKPILRVEGAGGDGRVTVGTTKLDCAVSGVGPGTGTCAVDISLGYQIVYAGFAPAAGFVFESLTGLEGLGGNCATGNCSFALPTEDTTLRVKFRPADWPYLRVLAGGGDGRVTGAARGISCDLAGTGQSGACNTWVEPGAPVTLAALSAAGFAFSSWTFQPADLPTSCLGASCTFTPVAGVPVSATATFVPGQRTLRRLTVSGTDNLDGEGTVTGDVGGFSCFVTGSFGGIGTCGADLPDGTVVMLGVTPAAGSEFMGWSIRPTPAVDCGIPDTSCPVTLAADTQVIAGFNRRPAVRVSIAGSATSGSGRVTGDVGAIDCAVDGAAVSGTCQAIVQVGAAVTLTAIPAAGFTFSGWAFTPPETPASCLGASCAVTPAGGAQVVATPTFVPVQATVRRLDVIGSALHFGAGTVTSDVGGISCALAGSSAGTGTCGADLPDGTVVTLSATAAAGSSFAGWDVQPLPLVPCAAGAKSCAVTLGANTTVTAAFDRLPPVRVSVEGSATSGSGRVTGDVGSLDCAVSGAAVSGTCQALVQVGSSVTLTAIPGAGFTFSGWAFTPASASASCVGASCTVTPAAGVPVVATPTFAPVQATLRHLDVFGSVLLTGAGTVTSDVGGISCTLFGSSVGTGTCGADLPDGTVVTLSATAASGSSFATWNVQPPPLVPCAAGATSCTVTLTADTTVTAAFDRLPPVRLLVEGATTSGSGTITSDVGGISCTVSGSTIGTGTCEALLPPGTVVTLTATPDAGSGSPTWDVWSPGAPCAPGSTCTVTMNGARTVAAGFALLPTVRLTVDASGMAGFPTGRITSSPAGIDCVPDNYLSPGACTLDVASGTEVTLTATPAAGYAFTGMTFTPTAPACTTSPCAVTVTAATRATATFVPLATRTIRVMTSGTPLTMNNGEAGTIRAIQGGATCDFSVCMAPNHPLNGGGFVPCFCYPLTTETVVLKATANAGYTFSGWDLGCTSVNPARDECTIGPDSSDVTTAGTFTMP